MKPVSPDAQKLGSAPASGWPKFFLASGRPSVFNRPTRIAMTTSSPPQRSITLLLAFLLSLGAAAQDAETNGPPKIFRDKVEPHWFAANNRFWYRVSVAADRHEFVLVDAAQGTRVPAFDHERLAKALTQQTGKTLKPDQLPFASLKLSDDVNSVEL